MDFKPVHFPRKRSHKLLQYTVSGNRINLTISREITRETAFNKGDRIQFFIDRSAGVVCLQSTRKRGYDTRSLYAPNPNRTMEILMLRFPKNSEIGGFFKEGNRIEADVILAEPGQLIFKP